MNHELEDVEGLLREQAKRIEALEAALHEIDDKSIDHVAVSIARTALKRVNQQFKQET